MPLDPTELDAYLAPLDPNQADSVRLLRALILDCEPQLAEKVCTDKWYGGLLVYTAENGTSIYALGPRSAGKTTLHLMPYYCSTKYQALYGESLKKFASGKSCLTFTRASDLPLDAIEAICTGGAAHVLNAMTERDTARKAKKKAS